MCEKRKSKSDCKVHTRRSSEVYAYQAVQGGGGLAYLSLGAAAFGALGLMVVGFAALAAQVFSGGGTAFRAGIAP